MPSSGTTSYTITRDDLTTAALRVLRVIDPEGGAATPSMLTTGAEALNILIKHWAVRGLKLWTYQTIIVPLVPHKRRYTLGPVAADVICNRPLRVFEYGNFLRNVSCSCDAPGTGLDIPLTLIARATYREFGWKGATGITNSIYYNPTINLASGLTSPSTGYGELWVYVTAATNDYAIYLNCQRPIFDADDADQEMDMPSEWFNAAKWGLAAEMADEYEVPEPRIMRLQQRAEAALELCSDWSVEEASTTFEPDFAGMR